MSRRAFMACDICGAANAPFGLQLPGFRTLKPGQRPLRHCTKTECTEAATARWEAAKAAGGIRRKAPADPPAKPARQGTLI